MTKQLCCFRWLVEERRSAETSKLREEEKEESEQCSSNSSGGQPPAEESQCEQTRTVSWRTLYMGAMAWRLFKRHVLLVAVVYAAVAVLRFYGARISPFAPLLVNLSFFVWGREYLQLEVALLLAARDGPLGLPLIGHLVTINAREPHKSILEWKRCFGSVFTIGLPMRTTVLASVDAIKEAARSRLTSARPNSYLYSIFLRDIEGNGMILASGRTWKKARNFANEFLRSYGVGHDGIVQLIGPHAENMVRIIEAEVNNADDGIIAPQKIISYTVANVIYNIILGRSCCYNDKRIWELKQLLDDVLEAVQSPAMLLADSLPQIARFLPADAKYRKKGFELQEFFRRELEYHRRLYNDELVDEDVTRHNLFTAYFSNPDALANGDMDCILLAGDLWTGGMETTLTALLWAIIHFMRSPDVQEKLYDEITRTFGDSPADEILYSRRKETPYLEATLHEIIRIANVLPWNIPHRATEDMVVGGRRVPKDTNLMFSFSSIHHDPELFPQPDNFIPERFLRRTPTAEERQRLEDEGESAESFVVFERSPHFFPFGYGPRRCPGEALAMRELFVFLVSLVREFKFSHVPGREPSLRRKMGMTSSPMPFVCKVELRRKLEATTAKAHERQSY